MSDPLCVVLELAPMQSDSHISNQVIRARSHVTSSSCTTRLVRRVNGLTRHARTCIKCTALVRAMMQLRLMRCYHPKNATTLDNYLYSAG